MHPESDDSFIGIYSEFSISINGLMLLNAILFFYYFLSFQQNKNVKKLIISIYFMACSVLGYYGAGLIICTAAIILSFLSLKIGSI
ncbi:MAG: hypothetical protein J7497_13830, partial [Chitinophagaceae bacterium]|nr:hypothetical protein [Chitinophagaceae bacterium]